MNNLVKDLLGDVGASVTQQLGDQAQLSEAQAKDAMAGVSRVILGGLERKRQEMDEGQFQEMLSQLSQHEGAPDHVLGTLAGAYQAEGADVTAYGVLDEQTGEQAAQALQQQLGVAGPLARKLIPMLAPVIIGMILRKGQGDPSTPDRLSGVKSLLDRDGDGRILDDLGGMLFPQFKEVVDAVVPAAQVASVPERAPVREDEVEVASPSRAIPGPDRLAPSEAKSSAVRGGLLGGLLKALFGGRR